MKHNASFWRNVVIIGVVHLVVLAGLLRWSATAKKPLSTDIIWMDGAAAGEEIPVAEDATAPTPDPQVTPMEDPLTMPTPPPEESEIATPAPTAQPSARPKTTPKPTPRPTPKKALLAKASPKSGAPSAGKKPGEAKKISAKANPSASSEGGSGGAVGSANASQFGWYGSMLHDRFFGAWAQPKSVAMSGARMSALVRIRIEKEGRISDFSIVRSSGNVVVDESVTEISKRVTQVDPPPAALSAGGHYDVQINFELNPE